MRKIAFALLLGACTATQNKQEAEENPDPRPKKPLVKPGVKSGMPEGFSIVGKPRVEAAYLEPKAAWRALRSRLRTLQAEAVARGLDVMVTFEEGRVHATTKGGTRRTWDLPSGLRLSGCPVHLLLAADYSARLYRGDHSQVPLGGEVTVVAARLGSDAQEFRLTIKGGRTIRSISDAG